MLVFIRKYCVKSSAGKNRRERLMNSMEGAPAMKIGDLVRLSSYGKKRKRAEWILHDDVGLIIRVIKCPSPEYPQDYIVKWMKSDYSGRFKRWHWERYNTRADLKYAK